MRKNVLTHLPERLPTLALLLCLQVSLLSCGGKTQPSTPPEAPPENPPVPTEQNRYKKGEILLIEAEGYKYFAKVTANTKRSDTQVPVQFFVADIRQKVGNKTALDKVVNKREKPKAGWGSEKVLLQHFDGTQWVLSKDVAVFEDYYLLPESFQGERKVPLSKVRIPIVHPKEAE